MSQFNLTWELHCRELFRAVIYMDAEVQRCLPSLTSQLQYAEFLSNAIIIMYPLILKRVLWCVYYSNIDNFS